MLELHLRQDIFIALADHLLNMVRGLKNWKKRDFNHIYKSKLDKACFAPDVAFTDSKDSTKTTVSDKVVKNRAYEIALNPIYDGYQRELATKVYTFLDE